VLEFGAPLRTPGPESAHEDRIGSLVGQFADFLRLEWGRYPWNIPWHHLVHYCALPEVDAAARGEKAISPAPQALPQ
jgi:hypothetical protein